MSSQGMQDHFGAKSANWQAMYRNCQPRFQVLETSQAEPCNEVETFSERWKLLINAVEKSYSIPRDLYFDTGQSLTPPHSGGCFYRMRYITSECAETSGVKGSTPESSIEGIFSGTLNVRMDAVRSFGSLNPLNGCEVLCVVLLCFTIIQ